MERLRQDGSRPQLRGLLRKYDCPGPRYTSYPTALSFHDEVGTDDYKAELARLRPRGHDRLSLYVHVPFCERRCAYCGCFVIPTKRRAVARRYVQYLRKEMHRVAECVDLSRIESFHLGGGTPTFLSASELEELFESTRSLFEFDGATEVSVELDPRVTRRDQLEALRAMGTNRVSLGVQDVSEEVQEAIGRGQTWEETQACFELCSSLGFEGCNVDLVYGLPEQTAPRFERTLSSVLALRPQRVAVFGYAHVPTVRANQRDIDTSALPGPQERLDLFLMAHDTLTSDGYVHIGLDHYALPGDELAKAQLQGRLGRSFMGYTPFQGTAVVGLGVSSIGDLGEGYFQNEKKLSRYYARLDSGELPVERGCLLSEDDLVRRYVIHEILCNLGLDYAKFHERFGVSRSFVDRFAAEKPALEQLEADGLVELSAAFLRVTRLGRLFLRNVAMVFDAYLKASKSRRPVYSRTI